MQQCLHAPICAIFQTAALICVSSASHLHRGSDTHTLSHNSSRSHHGACASSRTAHLWMRWPDNRWMGGQICGVCPDHWLWCPLPPVGTECGMCPPQLGYWSLLQLHGSGPASEVAPAQHVHNAEPAHSSQYGVPTFLSVAGAKKDGRLAIRPVLRAMCVGS